MFLSVFSRQVRSRFLRFYGTTNFSRINTTVNKTLVTNLVKCNNCNVVVPIIQIRLYNSVFQLPTENEVSNVFFEQVCSETLESLCEFFEEIVESVPHLKTADIHYGDGVLTVNLGEKFGTYVINRQTPNKQIWLSSPTSGPKRYDLISLSNGQAYWVYKHDGVTLHKLLKEEISKICSKELDFSKCAYSKV